MEVYIRLIALDGGGYVHKMLAFLVKYPTDRLTTTTDCTVCTAGLSVRQDNIYKYYSNNIQKTHRTRCSLTSENHNGSLMFFTWQLHQIGYRDIVDWTRALSSSVVHVDLAALPASSSQESATLCWLHVLM